MTKFNTVFKFKEFYKPEHWLALLLTLNLIVIWAYPFFPTQDGHAHLEFATNIISLLKGDCPNINTLFRFTKTPVPTWITYLIAIPLLQIFKAAIVEKILFSLITICLTTSLYALLKTLKTSTFFIIPLTLFTSNSLAYMGGYNFMLATALYFIALRWWLITGRQLTRRNTITLTLYLIALFVCHLFALAAFCLSILAIELTELIKRCNISNFPNRSIRYTIAAFPTAILFIAYMSLPKNPVEGAIPLSLRLISLLYPTTLFTLSQQDQNLVIATSIAIWALVIYTLFKKIFTQRSTTQEFLFIILTLTAAMLLTPASFAGGWVIETRVQLYFYLCLLIWLAGFTYNRIERNAIISIFITLNLFCLYNKFTALPNYNIVMSSYALAEKIIPDNSNIMSVDLSPFTINYQTGEQNFRSPIPNLTGYLIADKHCVAEINNRSTSEKNSFPISYRDNVAPEIYLGKIRTLSGLLITPPEINIRNYQQKAGVKIDYIIIHGNPQNIFNYPAEYGLNANQLYQNLMRQVNAGFSPIYSSPDNLLNIYKPR